MPAASLELRPYQRAAVQATLAHFRRSSVPDDRKHQAVYESGDYVRILFHTEGGFAHFPGLQRTSVVDTSTLTASEDQTLRQLVVEARFYSLPAEVGTGAGKADCRTHVITVEDAGQSQTVRAIEPVSDAALKALIDALLARR